MEISAGVPQGSILGPLFFLIFINDIVDEIDASVKLFADDTSLYLEIDNAVESAEKLNRDIDRIHQWSEKWLVKFNPLKTESMVISRKQNKPVHPPLIMHQHNIQEVTSHKHLGVLISDNGLWHDHIDYIVKKAYKRLNVIRKLKCIADRFTLQRLYMSFIRPILEYGDVIWDCSNQSLIDKIENVQLDAARIVTVATKLTSIDKIYKETGWEKLSVRRERHRLILLHKIVTNRTPSYLRDLIPNLVGNQHGHNTRQSNNLADIRTRTRFYSDYFVPSVIKLWNTRPLFIRNSRSLNGLNDYLRRSDKKCPTYYYTGSRLGQILHSRLRMDSSSLNEHLFYRNLVDSPNCVCGRSESISHFLLHCDRYDELRNETIFSLNLPVMLNADIITFWF